MPGDLGSAPKIKRHSVKKAIELIRKTKKRKKTITNQVTNNSKDSPYCTTFQNNRRQKRAPIVGFSKSLPLSVMQMYIARQEWRYALNLFPRLLEFSHEIEPAIWKYAFIILLHTNEPLHLCEFLEQCAGARDSVSDALLERLLLLPLQENN